MGWSAVLAAAAAACALLVVWLYVSRARVEKFEAGVTVQPAEGGYNAVVTTADGDTVTIFVDGDTEVTDENAQIPTYPGEEIPENTLALQGTLYEEVMRHVDSQCQGPVAGQVREVCRYERPFTMIWDQNEANRVLPAEDYNADVNFYAYGDGDDLLRYRARSAEVAASVEGARAAANAPALQDPRCAFVSQNLPNSDKYIFFNNNKVLTHPDGPREPELCYVPPTVANVLYHEQLCSPENELLYHPDFADVVAVEGLDVHARVDKDIGTAMCVLRFRRPEETSLSPEEYAAKLGGYLQYLYKMDPERQYWRESTAWLFNKNQNDQTVIAKHMADKVWLSERLEVLNRLLAEKRRQIARYMRDPNAYINEYVARTGDEDPGDDCAASDDPEGCVRAREEEVAEHCARHGQSAGAGAECGFGKSYSDPDGVGSHLLHLGLETNVAAAIDRWAGYGAGGADGSRREQVADFVTREADFARVWDRGAGPDADDPRDKHAKESRCEGILLPPGAGEDAARASLGFARHEYRAPGASADTGHCVERGDRCAAYFMDQCQWSDLEAVDRACGAAAVADEACLAPRRAASCAWATGRSGAGEGEFNCGQYGRLFEAGGDGVRNYFGELDGERPDAGADVVSFLLNPGTPAFAPFEDGVDALHPERECVWRDKEASGCLHEFDGDMLPQTPVNQRMLYGPGAVGAAAAAGYGVAPRADAGTNLEWGDRLEIDEEDPENVVLRGVPEHVLHEDIRAALETNEEGTQYRLVDGLSVIERAPDSAVAGYIRKPREDDVFVVRKLPDGEVYNPSTGHYAVDAYECDVPDGMMLVEQDRWVQAHAPSRVSAGPHVVVSGLNTASPDTPRDSFVKCDVDPAEIGNLYTATVSREEVTLAELECGASSAGPGAVLLEGGKSDKCAVSPNFVAKKVHGYSLDAGANSGKFSPLSQTGLVYLDEGGAVGRAEVNGVRKDSMVFSMDPGLYSYLSSGRFSSFSDAKYSLGDPNLVFELKGGASNCQPAAGFHVTHASHDASCGVPGSDTKMTEVPGGSGAMVCGPEKQCATGGPDGTGLYHYTSPAVFTKKGDGVYSYTGSTENKLDKLGTSGVKSITSVNGPWETPSCTELYNELANRAGLSEQDPVRALKCEYQQETAGEVKCPPDGTQGLYFVYGSPSSTFQDSGVKQSKPVKIDLQKRTADDVSASVEKGMEEPLQNVMAADKSKIECGLKPGWVVLSTPSGMSNGSCYTVKFEANRHAGVVGPCGAGGSTTTGDYTTVNSDSKCVLQDQYAGVDGQPNNVGLDLGECYKISGVVSGKATLVQTTCPSATAAGAPCAVVRGQHVRLVPGSLTNASSMGENDPLKGREELMSLARAMELSDNAGLSGGFSCSGVQNGMVSPKFFTLFSTPLSIEGFDANGDAVPNEPNRFNKDPAGPVVFIKSRCLTFIPRCPADQVYDNGSGACECSAGREWNEKAGRCVPVCEAGKKLDETSWSCVNACSANQNFVNGACVDLKRFEMDVHIIFLCGDMNVVSNQCQCFDSTNSVDLDLYTVWLPTMNSPTVEFKGGIDASTKLKIKGYFDPAANVSYFQLYSYGQQRWLSTKIEGSSVLRVSNLRFSGVSVSEACWLRHERDLSTMTWDGMFEKKSKTVGDANVLRYQLKSHDAYRMGLFVLSGEPPTSTQAQATGERIWFTKRKCEKSAMEYNENDGNFNQGKNGLVTIIPDGESKSCDAGRTFDLATGQCVDRCTGGASYNAASFECVPRYITAYSSLRTSFADRYTRGKMIDKQGWTGTPSTGTCTWERIPDINVENMTSNPVQFAFYRYGKIWSPLVNYACLTSSNNGSTGHEGGSYSIDLYVNTDVRHSVFYLPARTEVTLYHGTNGSAGTLKVFKNLSWDSYAVFRYDLSTDNDNIKKGWGSQGSFKGRRLASSEK